MNPKSISSSRFKQLPRHSLLSQFLSRHDDSLYSGFISRLDRSPIKAKRLAFAKAFALNVVVLGCLIGLAVVTVATNSLSTFPAPFRLALCVTQDLAIMFSILVLLRSTTVPFFWGECRFRFHYGFRASELIIRKPPKAGLALQSHLPEDQRLERYWRMATHAVNPKLLYSNINALLSSEYWIMEYSAVFDAMERIAVGEFDEEALEFAVWKQDKGTWSSCELWRMHEILTDQQEVAMFKTFLTEAGKQELLAIWQDMLSTPSTTVIERSPSPKAYQAMVDKFAREGLDYETVWSQVSEKTQSYA